MMIIILRTETEVDCTGTLPVDARKTYSEETVLNQAR